MATGTITDNTTANGGTINNTVDATLTRVRTMLTGCNSKSRL